MSDDEDGWSNCIDANDMFVDDDIADIQCKSNELRMAIANSFQDRQWFKKSNFYYSDSENLLLSWDYYAKMVKEKWRYTLFFEGPNEYEPSMFDAIKTFDEIWKLLNKNKLIVELKKGKEIYRSRSHSKSEKIKKACDIGTPESKYVTHPNRFSPVGIPLFYGSFDKEGTKTEMQKSSRKKYYSTAKFILNKSINVIDLSQFLKDPGYYSEENETVEAIHFLNEFIDLISKPISREKEYLEYIPTQVFVEYLRHMRLDNTKIKGIIYKSSISDSNNIALFYSNRECKNPVNVKEEEDCLVLDSIDYCLTI